MARTGEYVAGVCETVATLWKQPNFGLTRAQLIERSGNSGRSVDAHLKALRASGLVYRRRMSTGSGREYLYYWQALLFYCEDEK